MACSTEGNVRTYNWSSTSSGVRLASGLPHVIPVVRGHVCAHAWQRCSPFGTTVSSTEAWHLGHNRYVKEASAARACFAARYTSSTDKVTLLDDAGRCWTLMDAAGRCWTLMDAAGRCWTHASQAVRRCWTAGVLQAYAPVGPGKHASKSGRRDRLSGTTFSLPLVY